MKRPWRTGIKSSYQNLCGSCEMYRFEKATFFATTKLWQIFAGFAWDTDSGCWQLPDKATSWHRHKGHRWQLDHSHLLISFLVTLWISKSSAVRGASIRKEHPDGGFKATRRRSSGWACFCIEICGSTRDVESPCSLNHYLLSLSILTQGSLGQKRADCRWPYKGSWWVSIRGAASTFEDTKQESSFRIAGVFFNQLLQ